MTRRGRSLLVASLVVALLSGVGAVLPVPYVVYQPGPTFNTLGELDGTALITIEGRETFPTTGNLNLTTVNVGGSVRLGSALVSWFDGTRAVVPRSLVFPPDQTTQEVREQNTVEMVQSQDTATLVALAALGIPVQTTVAVQAVRAGTPADGVLEPGDRVIAVDGTAVSTPEALVGAIGTRAPGESVRLTLRRDGATLMRDVVTVADTTDPTRPVVGFTPGTVSDLPFTVSIELDSVGGPSAGLMFGLGIYDKLTPGSLTGGAFVAGTGTIAEDGTVGEIGGIRQKLVAARAEGAVLFLVPAGNCADAAADPPEGLALASVGTFDEGLAALAALREGTTPKPCAAVADARG